MLIDRGIRGVAQPGSAPALGAGGPQFKSGRPDIPTTRGRPPAPVAASAQSAKGFRVAHPLPVAQRIERRPSRPRVRGSNPFWRALPLATLLRKQVVRACMDKSGECSSVGRAPGCGPGGRGFKSLHSPQFFASRNVC